MKLRLKGNEGNSLRLRVSRSELERLQNGQALVEQVRLGSAADATFTYELRNDRDAERLTLTYGSARVTIAVPATRVELWCSEREVGIYETIGLAADKHIDIVLEKDFACLDRPDADNADTFEHPHTDAVC